MYAVFLQLLIETGKTVADVSRETGIGQSTFSNWKKRNNLLSAKNAKILADYFGVTVDYLMGVESVSTIEDNEYDPVVLRALSTYPELQQIIKKYISMEDIQKNLVCDMLGVKRETKSSVSRKVG